MMTIRATTPLAQIGTNGTKATSFVPKGGWHERFEVARNDLTRSARVGGHARAYSVGV